MRSASVGFGTTSWRSQLSNSTSRPVSAGNVILFESWLRHEVAANRIEEERISISFNFNWA